MRMSMKALLVVAALASGCAHTGLRSPENWSVVRTKHFNVYTSTTQLFEPTLVALEYSNAALSSAFFRGVDTGGPIDVLFLETGDFNDLFGYLRNNAALPTVPGDGSIGKNGLIVVQPEPEGRNATEMLTHLYIHKMMPAAPLWFHEGFAAWTKTVEYKEGEGQRVGCFGIPGGGVSSFVPLKELFTVTWDQYDDGPRAWYRDTSRALVDFVLFGEGGKNASKMGPLVNALKAGSPSATVVSDGFGSLDALHPRVVEHANQTAHAGKTPRGLCPLPFPIPDDRAPDTARKREPVPATEITKLVAGLRRLPRLGGYPPWFPPEVVAKAGGQ